MPASEVTASCVLDTRCRLYFYCSNLIEDNAVVVKRKDSGDVMQPGNESLKTAYIDKNTRTYYLAPGEYDYEVRESGSIYDSGTVILDSSVNSGVVRLEWARNPVSIYGVEIDGLGFVGTKECYYTNDAGEKIYPVSNYTEKDESTGLYQAEFVLKGTDAGLNYTFHVTPEDDRCMLGGTLGTSTGLTVISNKNISQQWGRWEVANNGYRVTVPEGSDLHAYRHPNVAYKEWGEVTPASTETADGKTTYTFNTVRGYLELVAGGGDTGFAKTYWSREFRNEDEEVEMEVPASGAEEVSPREVFNGLYLNVKDDGYYQALATGDTFRLEGYRVYQPTLGEISNRYLEPDMHYEVVSGDSVTVSEVQGGEGRHYTTVSAVKPGISIVKVTYDESYVANYYDGSLTRYDAIAPEQTGIVVFDVDGAGSAIETGIGLRKYDTVYFAGSVTQPEGTVEQGEGHGEYTFAPGEGVAVRTHKPYQIESSFDESTWEEQAPAEDGSYTIPVYTGRNIVELSKDGAVRYFVINAMETDVTISNLTNPGQAVKAGDEVSVGYTNLELPVQKMTAIYNPGWYDPNYGMSEDSGTFLVGTLSDGGEPIALRGERTQYDIQAVSEFTFAAPAAGDYELTGAQIHSTHMGSPLDSHCSISLSGLPQNLDADNNDQDPRYCVFPSVAVSVGPSAADQAAVDAFAAALGAVGTVTADSKDAVAAARAAYDSLTDAQKALVPAESLKALVDAEQAYAKAAAEKAAAEKAAADKAAADKAAASNVNTATVTAAQVKKASNLGVTTITLGKKVKKIAKGAFKGTKITTIIVKTKKLKKKSVKGSLKGSKVKTVKVQVGGKKVNKKYVKKYKKIFTKKVAGKKAKVK